MMNRITDEQMTSFYAVSASPAGKRVITLLNEELESMRKANDDLSGEMLTRNQGACKKLSELIDLFDTGKQLEARAEAARISESGPVF